jgi:hypothetical protein
MNFMNKTGWYILCATLIHGRNDTCLQAGGFRRSSASGLGGFFKLDRLPSP